MSQLLSNSRSSRSSSSSWDSISRQFSDCEFNNRVLAESISSILSDDESHFSELDEVFELPGTSKSTNPVGSRTLKRPDSGTVRKSMYKGSFECVIEKTYPVDSNHTSSFSVKKAADNLNFMFEKVKRDGEVVRGLIRKPEKYKTELCRGFKLGSCLFSEHCQFAHGVKELRPLKLHKNYKTSKCESYSLTGSCKFGSNCWFIHEENDAVENQLAEAMKLLSKKAEIQIDSWMKQ